MRHRTPEELKESGIEWIGQFPKAWNKAKLKHLYSIYKGNGFQKYFESDKGGDSDLIPYLSMEYLRNSDVKYQLVRTIEDHVLVTEGDALLLWDGSNAGEFIRGKYGALSSTLSKLETKRKVVDAFSYYLLKSIEKRIKENTIGMGIPHVDPNFLKSTKLPSPPLPEQRAIAAFLDRKTEAIDQLIEKKEQLIERLKEKRQALITRTVTKGLDPDVPMKDSGIEWLGEVPEHWSVTKIKRVSDYVNTGKTPSTSNQDYYSTDGIDWFSPADFNDLYLLKDSMRKISLDAVEELGLELFQPQSILIVGIGATVGRVGITQNESFSNQQINAIKFKENEVNPWFGLYQLDAFKDYIVSLSSANTLPIFNQSDTKELLVLKPPRNEQDKIVDFIKENSKLTWQISDLVSFQIQKLKEYRQSLISAAVTGKIDVRDEMTDSPPR